ncbi:MAG: hypothetical protein IJ644_00530 [Oscillospiraceae bacterium]|nr:hypothetical protein [Oscillospiraceae bacterium]
MIHYNIDTTENGYNSLIGKVKSLEELKNILAKNEVFPDLVGSLSIEDIGVSVCICVEKEAGFHVGITDDSGTYFSLGNKELLTELVDVWGDDLYISKGLFIPPHLAWKAIEEYITFQKLCAEINWVTPENLPEEANFLEL